MLADAALHRPKTVGTARRSRPSHWKERMHTFEALKSASDEFFRRHWGSESLYPVPSWMNGWNWSGSVPYHDKGGVYALFDAAQYLVYVGLGASRGGGIYKDHGISRRLLAHVIKTDPSKGRGFYVPRAAWREVKDIAAVGFPREYAYLAPSLEDYLIGELSPPRNSVKTNAKSSES